MATRKKWEAVVSGQPTRKFPSENKTYEYIRSLASDESIPDAATWRTYLDDGVHMGWQLFETGTVAELRKWI